MISRNIIFLTILLAVIIIPGTVSASYSGDETLTLVFSEDLNGGGYIFSTGNSTYSGQMDPGDDYSVGFDVELPSDAEPLFSRLYVYWAWSNLEKAAIYPTITVTDPLPGGPEFEMAARYTDTKGFVSSYDFFSGVDAYNVTGIHGGENSFQVVAGNSATDNSTFVLEGIGLLTVYESPTSPDSTIWIDEGCDMLYNEYGVTPDMATATAIFNGSVDTGDVKRAKLELIAPSGGYTRTDIPDKNVVYFNRDRSGNLPDFLETIFSVIFPGYNGKEWTDCFDSDEIRQIGVETREVGPYLRENNNAVQVQDRGDYLLFTNAILYIEKKSEE